MTAFTCINASDHTYPLLVSMPHSGLYLPQKARTRFLPEVCLSETDWLLPQLFSFLTEAGVSQIQANFSRYLIDANRDPAGSQNGSYSALIYERDAAGNALCSDTLSKADAALRFSAFYLPYHRALDTMIQEKLKHHKRILLLDLHSFRRNFSRDMRNEDLVLSNQNHLTADKKHILALRHIFDAQQFQVSVNAAKGGYTLKRYYTRYRARVQCVQLELREAVYLPKNAAESLYRHPAAAAVEPEMLEHICASDLFRSCQQRLQHAMHSLQMQLPARLL